MKKLIAALAAIGLSVCALSACSGKAADKESTVNTVSESQGAAGESQETQEAGAVQWPADTVQVTVPYKAGGGVDSAARLICSALEKETGKSFVITNKPEGNGIIAINELAKAEPNGYNLMVVSNRDLFGHIVNQIEGVEYQKDSFTYIASILETADALFVNTEKYPTFDKLIEAARENPGKITVAVSNNTGLQTLAALNEALGIQLDGIVYNGGSEAFADLLGNHVEASLVALSFTGQALQNSCAPVVTMTKEKVETLDGVPCIADYGAESAVSPMLRMLIGPAGMDQGLVNAMTDTMDKLYDPEGKLVAQLNSQYDIPNYMTHDKLMEFVNENFAFREAQAEKE